MKKIGFMILMLLLLLLAACGQSASGDQAEGASEDKVIRIGAMPDGYPQYFKEDGELKGFSVDIFEAIFKEIGYEVEWVLTDWTGVLANMQTGNVDTVANFAVTPEREEEYNFTTPYYHSKVVIAVGENNDSMKSLEDLEGKQVANVMGTNYENVLLEEFPNSNIEVVNYETQDVIYSDVASEKIDAFVSGREILLAQIQDKGIPLKIIGEQFGEKPVALPFAKNEEGDQLIQEVNQAIDKLTEDGTIKEISEKWYGMDVTDRDL
ncbi:transporter substrate-binding domain-containing protein [Oceanobacillus rekensis]|uniref:transporter substrate-binding domain-containing protein n=1 Tax=Oceanobacillus rekensis TaxID=937927 RepID=UPI000B42E49E|nr:transporter substrate-binding domain-containing protein [Oceanobacillus rekensis]